MSFELKPLLKKFSRVIPDSIYLKSLYKRIFGKKLSLSNPRTFNEKLQWLKIHDRKPIYSTMVDKYEAKEYAKNIIGEEYIIPTLGVWDQFGDIDFHRLPNQFVLKCTHDSGGLVICRDKENFDRSSAQQKIERCFQKNYYWDGREWPYKHVKPHIIAEKYMEDTNFEEKEPNEYQFWCFNGVPLFISVIFQPHGENLKASYDLNWNRLAFVTSNPEYRNEVKKPEHFEEMKAAAFKLCEDHIFVRVDFMVFNSRFYFGELTKSPGSGFLKWQPVEKDLEFGNLLDITKWRR